MSKFRYIFIASLAAVALSGCADEETEEDPDADVGVADVVSDVAVGDATVDEVALGDTLVTDTVADAPVTTDVAVADAGSTDAGEADAVEADAAEGDSSVELALCTTDEDCLEGEMCDTTCLDECDPELPVEECGCTCVSVGDPEGSGGGEIPPDEGSEG